GKECSKYARENVKRNKLENVGIIQGNVKNKIPKEKYDRIVMARPNLKDSFLDIGFKAVKRGGVIHYYGFYLKSEKGEMLKMIREEAKNVRRKIKILKVKKAGEIGTKRFRYRVDLKVLG
ncbi:MAG: hypothetical protein KKD94_05920, partial [Nanoarchaeota archaeon]|nr:hypothetical protein [Nanoarchaeota archaeon]